MRPSPWLAVCAALLACGCDSQRHDYVVHYQDTAYASLDFDGQALLVTARAAFADSRPAAAADGHAREAAMSADDRYLYVRQHPEIYGEIDSPQDYEEQFGEAAGGGSTIEIVMSGQRDAKGVVMARAARLVCGAADWPALETASMPLQVGAPVGRSGSFAEGPAARIHFPALPGVAPRAERLTHWQITRRPAPAADPIELKVAVQLDGRSRDVTFRFDRIAEHPSFPPNPLYWLYAAH